MKQLRYKAYNGQLRKRPLKSDGSFLGEILCELNMFVFAYIYGNSVNIHIFRQKSKLFETE